MSINKTAFYLLTVSAALINFSFIPGSKFPLYYILGILLCITTVAATPSISKYVIGKEDVCFLFFVFISFNSFIVGIGEYEQNKSLSQLANFVLTYLLFKFFLLNLIRLNINPHVLLKRIFFINTGVIALSVISFGIGLLDGSIFEAIALFFNNAGNFSIGAVGVTWKTARLFGFGPEPSFWSFYIAMNISLGLILERPLRKLMLLNLVALLLTAGRTGILMVIVVTVIKFYKSSTYARIILIVGALTLIIVMFTIMDDFSYKPTDLSIEQRLASLTYGFKVAKDNVVFGIGLGNFREHANMHHLEYLDIFNLFLNVLVSVGAPGLLVFIILLLCLFYRMEPRNRIPFYAALVGWLTVSAYNLPFVWVILAALIYAKLWNDGKINPSGQSWKR